MDILDDALKAVTNVTSGLWAQPSEKPGLVDGKLRPCPATPNCVCSEGSSGGERIEPLVLGSIAPKAAWARLEKVIGEMGGQIRHDQDGYLWATFTVPVFGFTDDVECRLDAATGVVHIRSASRIGFSDLGVNRNRIEELRGKFAAAT